MKRVILLCSLAVPALNFLSVGQSLAYNQTIKVSAQVLPIRAVYVNDDGYIYKAAGNTSDNIQPRVFNLQNQPIQMTDQIQSQYNQFLKSQNNHLDAGKTYDVNPIIVNAPQANQSIQINITGLTLGSGRID